LQLRERSDTKLRGILGRVDQTFPAGVHR
jgi:hypothetical protein